LRPGEGAPGKARKVKDYTLTPAQGTLTVKRPLKCP